MVRCALKTPAQTKSMAVVRAGARSREVPYYVNRERGTKMVGEIGLEPTNLADVNRAL